MRPSIGRSISRLTVVLSLGLAIIPTLARADGASAGELRSRADDAMNRGAFASAIATYRASYDLSPSPALLYNIGNAYEHLGDYPHALSYLERFANVAPPSTKARVPHLEQLIESVRGRVARLSVRCAVPGARVLVRGGLEGTTPLSGSIAVMPGDALVEVSADGYRPYAHELLLAPGRETRVDVVLTPELVTRAPPPERAAPASTSIATKWWFWTGVGVLIAGGTAVAIVALSKPGSAGKPDAPPGHVGMPLVSW